MYDEVSSWQRLRKERRTTIPPAACDGVLFGKSHCLQFFCWLPPMRLLLMLLLNWRSFDSESCSNRLLSLTDVHRLLPLAPVLFTSLRIHSKPRHVGSTRGFSPSGAARSTVGPQVHPIRSTLSGVLFDSAPPADRLSPEASEAKQLLPGVPGFSPHPFAP